MDSKTKLSLNTTNKLITYVNIFFDDCR